MIETTMTTTNAVRVLAVDTFFTLEHPDGEFSFGAATAGALTLAHVRARVADASGREAEGWGAIFLSHPWAFPTDAISPEAKDALMRGIVEALAVHLASGAACGHPLDHFLAIEPALGEIAAAVARERGIDAPVPPLATLVCLSPIDAALHDAYGHLHGISAYDALGREHVGWDLSAVLGGAFAGRYLTDVLRPEPVASVPVWHTVGGADPLWPEDVTDGSLKPLAAWIADDGVFAFKVKLKGRDLGQDISRLVDVYDIARESGVMAEPVRLFGDLNEQAPSLAYIRALLDGVRERSPRAFAALQALEQPDRRDMGPGAMRVGELSADIPIALDEGLVSLAALDRAVALGWNAVCLKTCKTHSLMLLALAKATALGLRVSMQDLTNPGIALVHAAGFAARLPVTMPMETNQRQYFPRTSGPEAAVWPGLFTVSDGRISLDGIGGPGLGYDVTKIDRERFRAG